MVNMDLLFILVEQLEQNRAKFRRAEGWWTFQLTLGGELVEDLKIPTLKIKGLNSVADSFHDPADADGDGNPFGTAESFGFEGISLDYEGTVVEGDRHGRELGFPTANLDTNGLALPPNGVYAVHAQLGQASRRDGSRFLPRLRPASGPGDGQPLPRQWRDVERGAGHRHPQPRLKPRGDRPARRSLADRVQRLDQVTR